MLVPLLVLLLAVLRHLHRLVVMDLNRSISGLRGGLGKQGAGGESEKDKTKAERVFHGYGANDAGLRYWLRGG